MSMIFGAGAAYASSGGIFNHPVVILLLVVLSIIVFLKFCGWAKKFSLSSGVKKTIYILTGIGLIVFNYLYSVGNKAYVQGDTSGATIALLLSLGWVLIFAFAIMAETKPE